MTTVILNEVFINTNTFPSTTDCQPVVMGSILHQDRNDRKFFLNCPRLSGLSSVKRVPGEISWEMKTASMILTISSPNRY